MKNRKYITKAIHKTIEQQIKNANEELGIDFNVDDIIIYGSTLTDKDVPGDIDLFFKISNVKSEFTHDFEFNETNGICEEVQFENHLTEVLHEFFHGDFIHTNYQPNLNGYKVDINVSLENFNLFEYGGDFMKLDDFFTKQELIYGQNEYMRNKIILFHGTSNDFVEFSEVSISGGGDPNSSLGIHATTSPFYAAEYASLKETLNKKESFVYVLEVEYDNYDHILCNDEFYGTELDETNNHEHFKDLRNEYLEENVDLIFFEVEDNITTILNPNNIKIINKLSIKDAKKLDAKLNNLHVDPLKDFQLVAELVRSNIKKRNLKLQVL